MYGIGLYLDAIAEEVGKVKTSFDTNVRNSFLTVMTVILITVVMIILLALAINLHEHRLTDSRLQGLVQKFMRLQVNERRKFSRELHDGINQQLVSLKLRIELAEKKMGHANTQQSALGDLDIASTILNSTIQEVRQISHNLRPVMLDDLGLHPALRGLIEQFSEHTGIQVKMDFGLDHVEVSDDIETTIYRITQECLNNIDKHAGAQSVQIQVKYAHDRIYFSVIDNGCGFNTKVAQDKGIGLINMKERVEVIGGTLALHSSPDQGATVSAVLPCKQRWRRSA